MKHALVSIIIVALVAALLCWYFCGGNGGDTADFTRVSALSCDDKDPETIEDIRIGDKCRGYVPHRCLDDPCDAWNGCGCGNTFCAKAGNETQGICRPVVHPDHSGGTYRQEGRAMAANRETSILALVSADVVRVVDSASWRVIRTITHPRMGSRFRDVALSPTGGLMALVDEDKSLRVYDVATMRLQDEWEHDIAFYSRVVISPDGAMLATGTCSTAHRGVCRQGTVFLHQPDALREHRRLDLPGAVTAIAFSNDSRLMAVLYGREIAGEESGLWIGDTNSLKPLYEKPLAASGTAVALSPKGDACAVATMGQEAILRMISLGDTTELWSHSREGWPLTALSFSPDGGTITAARNGEGLQMDARSGDILWTNTAAPAFADAVTDLVPSPAGDILYAMSAAYPGAGLYCLYPNDGSVLHNPWPARSAVHALGWSPNGDMLMLAGIIENTELLQAVDPRSGNISASMEIKGRVSHILGNHQGSVFALSVFDAETDSLRPLLVNRDLSKQWPLDCSAVDTEVIPRAFDADDAVVTGWDDTMLYRWFATTGAFMGSREMPWPVLGLNATASRVITIDDDSVIRIYDAAAMEEQTRLPSPCAIEDAALLKFSPDESRLIGLMPPEVFVYDLERSTLLYRGSYDPAQQHISPNGAYMASGGDFASVRVQRLSDGRELLQHICNADQSSTAPVTMVRFSANGNTLFSNYHDIAFQLLDVSWLYEKAQ